MDRGNSTVVLNPKILLYILVIILALVWITPVWTSLLSACKSPPEFLSQSFYQLPESFSLIENMRIIFSQYKMGDHILSTAFYAAAGGFFTILLSTSAAYGIVRLRPKFSLLLFMVIYSGTLFPFQMYLIPLYKYFNRFNLYDTHAGLLLVYIAITIPFAVFVFRGFYQTIPREIEDSAKIDGCSSFQAFIHIFLPQSAAPTAVVALFQMTWIWNDLLFGMVLTRSINVRPIMVALASMSGYGGGTLPLIMAAVLVASIPTIALYIILRRYFIQGLSQHASLK